MNVIFGKIVMKVVNSKFGGWRASEYNEYLALRRGNGLTSQLLEYVRIHVLLSDHLFDLVGANGCHESLVRSENFMARNLWSY